jgi:hypothetical protein
MKKWKQHIVVKKTSHNESAPSRANHVLALVWDVRAHGRKPLQGVEGLRALSIPGFIGPGFPWSPHDVARFEDRSGHGTLNAVIP